MGVFGKSDSPGGDGLSPAAVAFLIENTRIVYGSFSEPLVKVVNAAGTLEDRAVVLGNSDDFWVAVREGLQEGDQVAMESAEVGTSRFSFRQFRRVTGASGRGGSGGGSRGGQH